jgi:hypothetical protein
MFAVMKTFVTDILASTGRNDFIFDMWLWNMKNSKSHGKQEVDVQKTWKGETRYKSPCQSHISNIKSFLPVEAEISVTKIFIMANMKNSVSLSEVTHSSSLFSIFWQ